PLLEYFGQPLEVLKNWGINETIHPEDLPRVIEIVGRSLASGLPFESVHRNRRFDGQYRWFDTRGVPFRDGSGRIARWYLLVTDIEERRRAEEALRESEREARLIVDSIPGMVAIFAPTGELEVVNPQVLEYFGKTLQELTNWGEVVHPDDLPRAAEV